MEKREGERGGERGGGASRNKKLQFIAYKRKSESMCFDYKIPLFN